uniref:Uncharacterized protein n=1 Tax=Anguilla anguilla TaxID=7936 RepID=A0A0E9XI41_ANGAN
MTRGELIQYAHTNGRILNLLYKQGIELFG